MRKIEPAMIKFLDAKLKSHGAAQAAMVTENPRALLIYAAQVCVGIKEVGRNNDGPMVRLIQETVGVAEYEAWCMSLVQTLVAYCEVKTGLPSDLYPTESCTECWEKTPKMWRVKKIPLPGAIPIWQHGTSWRGHTGVLLEYGLYNKISCVEGNTETGLDSHGNIIREGGGVYQTVRDKKADGNMKLRGYLVPFPSREQL